MAMRRYGLISDTHGFVHPSVHELLKGVDTILHAGDVGDGVLEELQLIAPVYAVRGNTDGSHLQLPMRRVVDLPFGRVGMIHGHEMPTTKESRTQGLYDAFAATTGMRLIIFGHTHQQFLEYRGDAWLVNPGAAGRPRFGTIPSVCVVDWDEKPNLLTFSFRCFWH